MLCSAQSSPGVSAGKLSCQLFTVGAEVGARFVFSRESEVDLFGELLEEWPAELILTIKILTQRYSAEIQDCGLKQTHQALGDLRSPRWQPTSPPRSALLAWAAALSRRFSKH